MSKQHEDYKFWITIRQGLLQVVGAIERYLSIHPLTSELRKEEKAKERMGVEEHDKD